MLQAMEMLLFNYKMPAEEALQYGFVNEIYKPEEIHNKVWDKIIQVTKISNEALIAGKKLIRDQYKNHLLELNDTELKVVFDLDPLSKL
jgi:enoyl-CoA hydratase/carnithine racemase